MRGRRARFPPVEKAAPRPLGTLRFGIPVQGGKHVVVTLNDASRSRLVRALGSALHDSLTAPGVVCTPTKVRTHVDQLRRFLQFLDDAGESVDRVEAIKPALLDRYEVWLKQHTYAGAIYRRHLLARPIALLRRIEELKPGTFCRGCYHGSPISVSIPTRTAVHATPIAARSLQGFDVRPAVKS